MGLRFTKHIKLSKHIRLNISKLGVGISGGIKGTRISYNPKTGIRRSIGIPGSGIYYSDQHKLKNNKKVGLPDSNASVKDYNLKKFNMATNKLFKNCLKIFISCIILNGLFFKSNLLIEIIAIIEVIIYIGTYNNIYKRYKACNKKNISLSNMDQFNEKSDAMNSKSCVVSKAEGEKELFEARNRFKLIIQRKLELEQSHQLNGDNISI